MTAVEALLSASPYKIWPNSVPVGEGANAAFGANNTFVQDFASAAFIADTSLEVHNYDQITVDLSVEIVSSFGGEALLQDLWGAGAGSSASSGATNLSVSRTSTSVTVLSDTGTDANVLSANDSLAGVMSAADKTKLDGIEPGAQVNPTGAAIVAAIDVALGSGGWQFGATNLSHSEDANAVTVTSDTGNDAVIPGATVSAAGVMTAADKTKLDGIEASADANLTLPQHLSFASDAFGLTPMTLDPLAVAVTSNGTAVTAFVDIVGTGDIAVLFSTGLFTVDATPAASVALVPGTNSAPTLNYLYIPISTKTLSSSTAGWPSEEYVAIGTVLVQSAASVQTDGPYSVNVFETATRGSTLNGRVDEITKWIRSQNSRWVSGMAVSATVTTNGASDDDIDIAIATGVVLRGREIAFPARDTAASDSMYVYNSSVAAYTKVGTLATALKTNASGGAIASGQYASVFVWAATSENAAANKIMVNLPVGYYPTQKQAQTDYNQYTSYSIPTVLKNNAVPLARLVFLYTSAGGGTWSLTDSYDMRGRTVESLTGLTSSAVTEFFDDEFKLHDNSDSSKVATFQLDNISTATTRTYTLPNADSTFSVLEIAQAFAAGAKKTFSHSATTAGIKIAGVAGDPSSPEDGDVWYNLTTNKFRKRQNGVTEDLDTQGSAAPGGSDNQFTYNDGGAFGGSAGFVYNEANTRAVAVNGLEVGEVASPATPAANRILIVSKDRANRSTLSMLDEKGLYFPLGAAALGADRFWGAARVSPGSAAPVNLGFAMTGYGTGAAATISSTNLFTKLPRVTYTTAASANTAAGVRNGALFLVRDIGFLLRLRFGVSGTVGTTPNGFFGLQAGTAQLTGSTAPSAFTQTIYAGWDSGQTTLRIGTNDGTGTATTTDLGANFPVNTSATDIYDVTFYCTSDTSQLFYHVLRVNTGNEASGTITTDLPTSSSYLALHMQINPGATAEAVQYSFFGAYFESDTV